MEPNSVLGGRKMLCLVELQIGISMTFEAHQLWQGTVLTPLVSHPLRMVQITLFLLWPGSDMTLNLTFIHLEL